MNPTAKTEAPKVAFGHRLLQEGLTQGASHIHVEPVDDDVVVRYRIGREYREFAKG
jgi:type II secretory ATPase GspE/PulE/Tfp pilus assembly ATPase PilB-like protein